MKDPIKNIKLAFPCQKNWKDIEGNGKERFCSQCQHKVKDFTKSTAAELQVELSNCTRVCGRFKSSQLHPSFLKTAAVTTFLAASLGACTPEPQPILPTIPIEEDYELLGDVQFTGIIISDLDSIEYEVDEEK